MFVGVANFTFSESILCGFKAVHSSSRFLFLCQRDVYHDLAPSLCLIRRLEWRESISPLSRLQLPLCCASCPSLFGKRRRITVPASRAYYDVDIDVSSRFTFMGVKHMPVKFNETLSALKVFDEKKRAETEALSKMCTDLDLMEQRNLEFGYNQFGFLLQRDP